MVWQALELARNIKAADTLEVLPDDTTLQRIRHARTLLLAGEGRLGIIGQFGRLSLQGRLINDL